MRVGSGKGGAGREAEATAGGWRGWAGADGLRECVQWLCTGRGGVRIGRKK